jgi:3-deoxy-D-manno-octulosonate 8-phosphate phosphatase (KDO 8-P phosphatase)
MPNSSPKQAEIFAIAQHVKLLVLDVDGVLTDGKLYFSSQGAEMKAFNTLDGQGLKLLQNSGVKVAIITGRQSALVSKRAEDLGIKLLHQGREDKLVVLDSILESENFTYQDIAYVGDDLPDLACMRKVALPISVPNAHTELKKYAFCITTQGGGEGAVREVCDWILQAQHNYDDAISPFM